MEGFLYNLNVAFGIQKDVVGLDISVREAHLQV
jgi:hypothetical protein